MNCYNCGVILNRKNRSVEHIINASIGGFKKGYNLLCQACNKEFGRTIDNELGKQLSIFGALLNIPLDRGEHTKKINSNRSITGGTNYQRALVKMCLNYYLSKGYPILYCHQVRSFVRGDNRESIFFHYLPENEVHQPEDNEVSHIIHLHGSKETGVLYAYIELFNMQSGIVIFNMEYSGEDIHVTYCRDVVKNKELPKNMHLGLTRQQLEDLKHSSAETSAVRYERLMRIIEGQQLKS
jgi:hypothetical protein